MIKRVGSAVLGIVFMVFMIYKGGFLFLLTAMALSLLAAIEMGRMMKRIGLKDMVTFLYAGALLFPLLLYFEASWLPSFLALFVFSGAVISLSQYPEGKFQDLGANFLAVLYIGFGFSHFVLLREMEQGMLLLAFGFVVVWMTDIGAYLVGTYFGKRPFFQDISPSKTVEGAIGGLACGIVGAILFCNIVGRYFTLDSKGMLIVISVFLSAAAQTGDLFESAIKRQARVKDSSRLIPGHGGIMDRIDSMLFTLMVVCTYMLVVNAW